VEYDYEVLTPETASSYVAGADWLAGVVDASTLKFAEVGDGNLNLVFVGSDAQGQGICVKQALPYLRLVGESWPLTPERATSEARAYEVAARHAPEFVPGFYGFDKGSYVLAMENLSDWEVWRTSLNNGEHLPGIEAQIGTYVARMSFHTSHFMVDAQEHKALVGEALNPQLCEITEQLVFTEPYIDHENNEFPAGLDDMVQQLRADQELRVAVDGLKHTFMTRAEALIHGDLHTGSVMVRGGADGPAAKAIDPEFCFYGPVAFDLGALFGNYLAARSRAVVLGRPEPFRSWVDGLIAGTWRAFESEMRRLWPERTQGGFSDAFLDTWLRHVWHDAVGFAGCKAIRRVVGLAKVSDLETLEAGDHLTASEATLKTAATWIKTRREISNPEAMLKAASQHL
jgi:5-methylthioribose kinase